MTYKSSTPLEDRTFVSLLQVNRRLRTSPELVVPGSGEAVGGVTLKKIFRILRPRRSPPNLYVNYRMRKVVPRTASLEGKRTAARVMDLARLDVDLSRHVIVRVHGLSLLVENTVMRGKRLRLYVDRLRNTAPYPRASTVPV